MSECYKAQGAELHLGRWQEALAHVDEVSTLIVDAPYSERTHSAHNAVATTGNDNAYRAELSYKSWTRGDVEEFVGHWSPRTRGWFVSITDTELYPDWRRALEAAGRYCFSPLACVVPGSRVRQLGDGPSQWSTWAVVARPRTTAFARWGALDGAYVQPAGQPRDQLVTGGKPIWLMRALVRDYSRPGDLVCDPCAGGGTTLLAALTEGRRAVGAECMPEHYEIARKRLARGFTPTLFSESAATEPEQLKLGEP